MIRLILLSPFFLLAVLFALSNTATVPVGLWPTAWRISAPLSVIILLGMGAAFTLGLLTAWLGSLPHRRRARRAESKLSASQAELDAARARLAAATAPPPPAPPAIR